MSEETEPKENNESIDKGNDIKQAGKEQESFADTLPSLTSDENVAIKNVNITLSAVLGKTTLRVSQLLKLGRGAVVELNHHKDDPIELIANNIRVAEGEVVATENNKIGIKITEIMKSNF